MASGSVLLACLIAVRGDGLFRNWSYTVRPPNVSLKCWHIKPRVRQTTMSSLPRKF